jgi:hypothetical protein
MMAEAMVRLVLVIVEPDSWRQPSTPIAVSLLIVAIALALRGLVGLVDLTPCYAWVAHGLNNVVVAARGNIRTAVGGSICHAGNPINAVMMNLIVMRHSGENDLRLK